MQGESADRERDTGHLKILAIFYYVGAAWSVLVAIGGILYLSFAETPIVNPGDAAEVHSAEIANPMIHAIGGGMLAWGVLGALFYFLTARGLTTGGYQALIYVVAILTLLSFPLGTILGVFTLVVMNRPSVKARFAAN